MAKGCNRFRSRALKSISGLYEAENSKDMDLKGYQKGRVGCEFLKQGYLEIKPQGTVAY